MRLQVFLSHNGVCSRRDAMDIIKARRVTVDGKVVVEPSMAIMGNEVITVDGKQIQAKPLQYLMLHKPVGYTTTKEDRHADHLVMDILPKEFHHLVPIGRLDRDSSGLLLFTNDGQLAHQLTHPSFEHEKTYAVILSGKVNAQKIDQLKRGVTIEEEDGPYTTVPCTIKDIVYNGGNEKEAFTSMLIILTEGRKRQIRLMAKAVGHHVLKLSRIAQGPIQLGDLPVGQWRELTPKEIECLRNP